MILGEIDSALSLFGRLRAWWQRRHEAAPVPAVTKRFIELFAAHGVHRNQIPRLLDGGLTLGHLVDDTALSAALTSEHLTRAAALFGVQLAWLEGATDQVYPLHDFYKQPEQFEAFLPTLHTDRAPLCGVLLVSDTSSFDLSALLILEETVGELDEKPLYRYHLCSNWVFAYWKARAYLTACVASAWRHKVWLTGRRVSATRVRQYAEGSALLESGMDGALPHGGAVWHPEDMLINPEAFLGGLAEGVFGQIAGLRLWLALDAAGLMRADLPYPHARAAFEAALDELLAAQAR